MTTWYWLLPEDNPCESHNNQWKHSSSLSSIITSKYSVLKPWVLVKGSQRHCALLSQKYLKTGPFLEVNKRKSNLSDYGSFGFGCGVRSTGIVPPRGHKSFAQPAPREVEPQSSSKRDLCWQREHLLLTSKHLPSRAPLPDKGKPVVRRGRKATDQVSDLKAGLPEEE